MDIDERGKKVSELILEQVNELIQIVERVRKDDDYRYANERLHRWKDRTVKIISSEINPKEGKKLKDIVKLYFNPGDPFRNIADEADMYRGFLLSLCEEIENHPEDLFISPSEENSISKETKVPQTTQSKAVFLVHGHDELNLLRLEKLIKEKWRIEPIVLNAEASKGRTIIEKFEQEAQRASYAFALFTPDDFIEVSGKKYAQARPNVIFELGWFYGRLGRDRVCILFKKGTEIHSDLDEVMRVEFNDSVNECIIDIERELRSIG